MTSPLVFLDTETTGLSLEGDDIWELAAVRREIDGTESEFHALIDHNPERCGLLPEPFKRDHFDRFDPNAALGRQEALIQLALFLGDDRPHIVGAVPNFDTERLSFMYKCEGVPVPRWHYHLIDVENLAVGFLAGVCRLGGAAADKSCSWLTGPPKPPWDSNDLSRAVGVDPDQFERHTAMGDVRWAMAIYDAVTTNGGAA